MKILTVLFVLKFLVNVVKLFSSPLNTMDRGHGPEDMWTAPFLVAQYLRVSNRLSKGPPQINFEFLPPPPLILLFYFKWLNILSPHRKINMQKRNERSKSRFMNSTKQWLYLSCLYLHVEVFR